MSTTNEWVASVSMTKPVFHRHIGGGEMVCGAFVLNLATLNRQPTARERCPTCDASGR